MPHNPPIVGYIGDFPVTLERRNTIMYPLFEIGDWVSTIESEPRSGKVVEHVDGQGGLTEYVVKFNDGSLENFPEYSLDFDDSDIYLDEYDDDYNDSWTEDDPE